MVCRRLLLALAVPPVFAQEPTAAPAPAPSAAAVHLEIAGPALWRAQFTPTNVGSLIASESGAALWRGYVQPLEGAIQQLLGLDDSAFAAARTRLLDYRGRLLVDLDRIDDDAGPIVRLRLTPDGSTDLAALAQDLARAAAQASGAAWQPGEGDAPRLLPLGGGSCLCEPFAHDGMVAVVAPKAQLAAAIAAARAATAPAAGNERARPQPPFAVHFDLQRLRTAADRTTGDGPLFAALGLDSLDRVDLSLGTAGPHVQIEVTQHFGAGDRGVFAVLFPDVQGLPTIGALLGASPSVKVGHLDLAALHDVLLTIVGGHDSASARQNVEDMIGPRDGGLLSQFTGEYLLYGAADLAARGDGNTTDWGLALRLRDGAAFAKAWQRARKELGMTSLASDDLGDGYRLERLGGFFQVTALVGPDLFAIAYGPDARDRIDQLVAAARRGAWTGPAKAPPAFAPLLRFAPPGWNGYGEGDVAGMLAIVDAVLQEVGSLVGDLPALREFGGLDEDARVQLAELLAEHQLQVARSLTGYQDRTWRFRVLW